MYLNYENSGFSNEEMRLTLTLDVFKFNISIEGTFPLTRLTLTLDVFK